MVFTGEVKPWVSKHAKCSS